MSGATLLDANVLVALAVVEHVHHDVAYHWFETRAPRAFATTPITQGALLRVLVRTGIPNDDALAVLESFLTHPDHELWPDDLSYERGMLHGVIGHRQITDAYLVAMARKRGGRLVTLDVGLGVAHRDVVELLSETTNRPQP